MKPSWGTLYVAYLKAHILCFYRWRQGACVYTVMLDSTVCQISAVTGSIRAGNIKVLKTFYDRGDTASTNPRK